MSINLMTDYDAALNAMAVVEGEGWLIHETEHCDADSPSSIPEAISILKGIKRRKPSDIPAAIIYGSGGCNRYFVYPDGRVAFSKRHAISPHAIITAATMKIDVT